MAIAVKGASSNTAATIRLIIGPPLTSLNCKFSYFGSQHGAAADLPQLNFGAKLNFGWSNQRECGIKKGFTEANPIADELANFRKPSTNARTCADLQHTLFGP